MRRSVLLSVLLLIACTATPSNDEQSAVSSMSSSEASVMSEEVASAPSIAVPTGYKILRYFNAQIPTSWSVVYMGEAPEAPADDHYFPLKYIAMSFAVRDVAYGDMNWDQVDIAFYSLNDGLKVLEMAKKENAQFGTWSAATVDGKVADVFTDNLDNGEVTKGGPGGKDYFIRLPAQNKMVRIWKQALGDKEFEDGFKYFLSTVDFES